MRRTSIGQSSSSLELEAEIKGLTRAILRLLPRWPSGWVPWACVAKEYKGSQEYSSLLQSMAGIEPWKRCFVSTDKAVKLTEDGYQFAQVATPTSLSEIGQVKEAVRQYATRLQNIVLTVSRVSKVAKVGERCVQAVHVDGADEVIVSETPCKLRPKDGGSQTRGRIIGQEPDGAVLYVAFDSEVCAASLPATLSIDRAFLLLQLVERLGQLRTLPARMVPALHPSHDTSVVIAGQDSLAVARQLAQLSTPWTRFLWGPPGAGKTYGIGRMLAHLVESHPAERTLIVAPSNRAVDVALEQFLCHLEQSRARPLIRDRRILRFGYPRKPQILERSELLGSAALDNLNGAVRQIAARIARAEREQNREATLAVLRTELLAAQEAVKNAVALHMSQCAVVATTTTLAYLPTSPVAESKWDNVIVDEVTMVTPAMLTFLASLATKRFLLAGDPRQLGPVYEVMPAGSKANSDDYKWMGRDIFDKSGIAKGEGELHAVNLKDERLARITCQRRCADAIWKRVSYLYPAVENQSDVERSEQLMQMPPLPSAPVVILDTGFVGQQARCEKSQQSWQNPFHADLALDVVRSIVAASERPLSVAIIAPYRAQVKLLRHRLRAEQRALRSPWAGFDIDAGTVHQFQGSDADIIIFDMVDGSGRQHVGNLLKSDAGLRLVNVAFTRAKGKLIVIGDRDWCGACLDRSTNALLHEIMAPKSGVPSVRVETAAASPCPVLQPKLEGWTSTTPPDAIPNHPIYNDKGEKIAQADFVFPDVCHAVFLDKCTSSSRTWTQRPQHRHHLADLGWTFSVFRESEWHAHYDACTAELAEVLRQLLERPMVKPKREGAGKASHEDK